MGGGGHRFGLNRQYSGRGGESVKQGVNGKNEKTIGKSEKHAERDSQNKPGTVRFQVWDPKGPDFFEYLHTMTLTNFGL